MFHNSNNEAIKKLSIRSLKANRTRNIFAILAIVFTTLLFTVVFTSVISLFKGVKTEKMRQIGTRAHVVITNIDDKKIESIKEHSKVQKVGRFTQIAGKVDNPNIKGAIVGLSYLDDDAISMKVYDDFKGVWPKNENEIAVPTWVLDKMELPYKLGQKIRFDYITLDNANSNNSKTTEFVLTAYYKEYTNLISGDRGTAIVSRDFRQKLELKDNISIILKDDKNVNKDIERICDETGLGDMKNVKVNPVYLQEASKDVFTRMVPVILVLFLIIICGYLMIYNIFYISITRDIKFYGLLKTLGATYRQIRKIIFMQGLKLSFIGIPIGLILGYGISFVIVPLISKNSNYSRVDVVFSPIVFITTIIFILFTVAIACRKPVRIAGKVSPVEAIRYVNSEVKTKKSYKSGRNGAKIYKMAISNVFRDKKKAVVVLISLSLGFACFICSNTFLKGMNVEEYIEKVIKDDFIIYNLPMKKGTEKEFENVLDMNFYKNVSSIEGVKDIKVVKVAQKKFPYEGTIKNNVDAMIEIEKDKYRSGIEERKASLKEYGVSINIIGVTESIFKNIDKSKILQGKIDSDQFKSGNFIVLSNVYGNSVKIGDKIDIGTMGKNKTVEVMAIIDESAGKYKGTREEGFDIYIDENQLSLISNEAGTLSIMFDVDKEKDEAVYSKLQDMIGNSSNIEIEAKFVKKQKFEETLKAYYIILGSISLILAFIGILNFINIMLTNMNIRKNEFAILEAVGMTKKQTKKMVILEGLYYGLITIITSSILGNMLAYYLIKSFSTEEGYGTYHFPATTLIGTTIVVILISYIIPNILFKISVKDTVVDRLKELN